MFPWVSIGAALAACEPASSGRTSSAPPQGSEVAPATTAPLDSSAPGKADVTSTPAKATTVDLDTPPATAEVAADVRNANAFAFKVLGRVKKPTDNVMISGTSVRLALGTTYLGARGATAREMSTALSLDNDAKIAARLAHAELAAWQDARGSAELNIASRVWLDDDFAVSPDFSKLAESAFGAAPASVDYAKAEDARKAINLWVAEKTKDKIADLLPQGSVDPTTRLIVTNAIWFKGRWELPFPKSATKDEPFKLDAKKTVSVPSMHLTDTFRVATLPGLKVLELRYAESQLAMLLVLPDDPTPSALAKIEASLSPDTLEKWTGALSSGRVNVTLPRFTFRSGGPMSAPLQDLGMRIAFTEKADFSGIAEPHGGERLFVGQVFHQTWIAVDELGTEAAAATGATMRTTSLVTGPVVEFRADHPFLFVVEDTKRERVLFAGRVANPKSP